jgi:hypothetical protein
VVEVLLNLPMTEVPSNASDQHMGPNRKGGKSERGELSEARADVYDDAYMSNSDHAWFLTEIHVRSVRHRYAGPITQCWRRVQESLVMPLPGFLAFSCFSLRNPTCR